MERHFRQGDIILFDGLYGCVDATCGQESWGVAGRRLGELPCGHVEWKLIRRRLDRWW